MNPIEEIETKLGKQTDLIYIEPRMNVGRMFKKMFLGRDIFDSGILPKETKQNDNKEMSEVPKVQDDTKVQELH